MWITEPEARALRAVIQQRAGAVTTARKIAACPQGVYPLQVNMKSPLETPLEYAQQSRQVAQLLFYDANLRAFDRDGAGAMESAYANEGRWPATLSDLAPKWMKTVPTDPFTGEAFWFKNTRDGLSVYCKGTAAAYNGGWFTRIDTTPDENPGFRLLAPESRR